MVTALAGLRHIEGVTRYRLINDTGIFDRYGDHGFTLNCWFYNTHGIGHGELDIVQAIERSCDFYFLQVSDWFPGGSEAGARFLAETAQEFGLGSRTGIEIPEAAGLLALPNVKLQHTNHLWYAADTLLAGFGQGINRFTPIQLANYAATIANGGTLYSLSILQSIKSADYSEELHTFKPEIRSTIKETDILEIIHEGMVEASIGRNGTARSVFADYPISVASKTGTVQTDAHGDVYNNAVFVAYAPAENPEIAISIVVEKGGYDGEILEISRIIFDHYFNIPR